MFDIYIKNYVIDGAYQTNEALMFAIPMAPDEPNAVIDPKVSVEMGKSGSFDFSMAFGHPFYDALLQMKTIFRIEYDGDTIFRGRVLSIDTGHLTGTRKVKCESDFSFFLDSQIEGVKEENRQKTAVLPYLQKIITAHNAQMTEDLSTDKTFVLGEVPGAYSNAIEDEQKVKPDVSYKYGSNSWKDSQGALTDLSNSFGGYFRTRYSNGVTYLDWLDGYYNSSVNVQTIELGENLIDITSNQTVNNVFTALIPLGSAKGKSLTIKGYRNDIHGDNDRILVPQIAQVFSDAELNSGYHHKQDYLDAVSKYGIIYKTQSFNNATTQAKLWEYATDWIKNNYIGGVHEFNISALDMHVIGESSGKFLVGDRVTVAYPDETARSTDPTALIRRTLSIISIEYDLYHPEKNSYKIGVPNLILKKEYGQKASKNTAGAFKDNDSTNSKVNSYMSEEEENYYKFVLNGKYNAEEYMDYLNSLPQDQQRAVDGFGIQTAFQYLKSWDNMPEWQRILETRGIILDGNRRQINVIQKPFISKKGEDVGQAVMNLIGASITSKEGANTIEVYENVDVDKVLWKNGQPFTLNKPVRLTATAEGGSMTLTKISGTPTVGKTGDDVITALTDGTSGVTSVVGANLGSWDPSTGIEGLISGLDSPVLEIITKVKEGSATLDDFQALVNGNNKDGTETFQIDIGEGAAAALEAKVGSFAEDLGVGALNTGDVPAAFNLGTKTIETEGEGGEVIEKVVGLFTGKDQNGTETVEIESTEGTASVGRETSSPNSRWLVKLNDTVTYEDEERVSHTVSGFVSADDFHIGSIPSFKTQFAVVNTLIAGKASVGALQALEIRVDELTGNRIVADTVLKGANFECTTGYANNFYAKNYFYWTSGSGAPGNCVNSFHDASVTFNNGVFTLTFQRVKGSDPKVLTFNVASSPWFTGEMEAAWENGGKTAWLQEVSAQGAHHQGTLKANTYYCPRYADSDGNTNTLDEYTWLTPSSSSTVVYRNATKVRITPRYDSSNTHVIGSRVTVSYNRGGDTGFDSNTSVTTSMTFQ